LTAEGELEAQTIGPQLAAHTFALVESSPRTRALRTAELAGYRPTVDDDLAEWDYGELEGLRLDAIRTRFPGWTIWEGPWRQGERPEQVAVRADRVIARVRALPEGTKALVFTHGHMTRVLAARWLGRSPSDGSLFGLGTATINVLGWEHDEPVVLHWNVPAPCQQGPATLSNVPQPTANT
jgi:probable phosphoglycerate mutase